MAPDMSDGPAARDGLEGGEGSGEETMSSVMAPAGSGLQTQAEYAQQPMHQYVGFDVPLGEGPQEGMRHLHPGATDEEVAALEEQARQLALHVGAAEFSPMGPVGTAGPGGGSHGAHGMHMGQNPAVDGMNMRQRGMVFGSPGMRGPMPYEMMQYYAQMQQNQSFFGGPGMMPSPNGEEMQQAHAAVGKAQGPENGQRAMPMPRGVGGNGAHANAMQSPQGGPQGAGVVPPYFNGYNAMMSPFGAFGPNSHMYGQNPFLGNMQGAPDGFWGGMAAQHMGMGMGGAGHGPHSPHPGGKHMIPHGIGPKGMRGGARERVMHGRMGAMGRGHMGVHEHAHSNNMGYKQRPYPGNGYHMHNKHDIHAAKVDKRHHLDNMQHAAAHHRDQGPQHRKGPAATTEAKAGSGDGAHGRPSDEDAEAFALNVARAETGEDARTTVMVKNIPNKYTQRNLLDLIDGNYAGKYDFFYLPIDFKNKCNLGYAFINFRNPTSIGPFFREFDQMRWERFNSDKICLVTYARIQGKQALVSHFRSSRLMLKHEKYRPLIFNDNGRPETIQINRAQPHPSTVLQSVVNGHRGGRGIMHPGMMQAPYQLMPMMPNQMAPNYDAPETDEFTPQQPGSFTSDESEALAKLLAADTAQVAQRGDGEDGSKDRDEDNAGASGATQADDPSGGARNGAKSSDQRQC
eukprot:Tamp_05659.p1 GENE.Tamp_05659~~Tamp_05659.p1  ORF type:complete len:786 (+),score=139.56 Tamp_05659:308-2359(+)